MTQDGTYTTGNFEFISPGENIQIKDVIGYKCAVFGTGEFIESDEFWDVQPGQADRNGNIVPNGIRQLGHLCHFIAFNSDTKEVKMSDPFFPSAIWQVVLKRLAAMSNRRVTWITFEVVQSDRPNKHGGYTYKARAIRDEETKDQLYSLIAQWYEENGIGTDEPISALLTIASDALELEAPARQEIEGEILDAEVIE